MAPDHWLTTESGAHYQTFQAARTRYFDDYLRGAADAGVQQVVILAAGLDSRAYRLAWPHGTLIYELDQPKVLEFKHSVLDAHGYVATAQRREVAVDLREDWPTALLDAGFEPGQPSAWLAEGLLPYLPRTAQEQLFVGIDTFASVAGEPAHLGRVRAVDRARTMIGEVAEAALDDAILAARAARPEGATWARLGEVLGVTGQAVSKRAGARSLSRQRQQLSPSERAERNAQRFAAVFGVTHRPGGLGDRQQQVRPVSCSCSG